MTASLHKLSAGDGYSYLTNQVARNDATHLSQRDALVDYYHARGERPGVWRGSGLASLGIGAGQEVTENQMKALYGEGVHPDADRILTEAIKAGKSKDEALELIALGRRFGDSSEELSPFVRTVAQRFREWNTDHGQKPNAVIAADARARIRSEVGRECFAEQYGRAPVDARELNGFMARESRPREQSVAGFDLTFSPAKSISMVWALGTPEVKAAVERAHQRAIDQTLAMIEAELTYTRRGAGGARQVETEGLISAQFLHRDSRAGDPDLHTHVVISNKVRAVEDGAWLALDGGPIHQGAVRISETYNGQLRAELEQDLGLQFWLRSMGAGRQGVWEVDGIAPELCDEFSTRRQAIEARIADLAASFQATHERPASQRELTQLAQQATLETRPDKHEPRSEAEQRRAWRAEAAQFLGGEDQIERMIAAAIGRGIERREVDVPQLAERIVRRVEDERAVWHEDHLHSRAVAVLQGHGLTSQELTKTAQRVVDAALTGEWSVRLDRADPVVDPPEFRRSDGTSQYVRAHSSRYTSARIIAAESTVLEAAGRSDGRRCSPMEVELALLESAANGRELNAGQAEMVRDLAGSGARVRAAIAPAGSGKTTALAVLATAWRGDGGTVIGLAPSSAAARELADAVGTGYTIDQLTLAIDDPDRDVPQWAETVDAGTLIVIDEAGMASTKKLASVVDWAQQRGASVRLVGDDRQLSSVETGGILRDIAAEHGAVGLDQLMRFSDPDEAAATLAAREGRHDAIAFYLDRGRVHLVDETLRADTAYDAWAADQAAGRQSLMMAATRAQVHELNTRARDWMIDQGVVEPTTSCALRVLGEGQDPQNASVGDVVVTRLNDRRITAGLTDFVKNGDRWQILALGEDGSLRVQHIDHRRHVTLPADYVAEHVDLGYASTIHAAQGQTVDTTHTILDGTEDRELFYVATSRGRHANRLYLGAADADDHNQVYEPVVNPRTATDILTGILDRQGAQTSARTVWRDQRDPATVLGHNARTWADAVIAAALHEIGPEKRAELRAGAEQVHPGLTAKLGWDQLEGHLAFLTLNGDDALARLSEAKQKRPLADVRDPAAVLDWRLDSTQQQGVGVGPLPWLRGVPDALAEHPRWGPYFEQLAEHLRAAAHAVWVRADQLPVDQRPVWAADLATGAARGEVAVWRAGAQIADGDEIAVGAPHRRAHEQRYQRRLARRLGLDRAGRRWVDQIAGIDPRIVHRTTEGKIVAGDPWWPVLAQRLDRAQRAGADVPAALTQAAGQGALPDDLPAAALWSRMAGTLGPVIAADAGTSRWRPEFTDLVTTAVGDDVLAQPGWRDLVAAVRDAEDAGLDARDTVSDVLRGLDLETVDHDAISSVLAARITDGLTGQDPAADVGPADVAADDPHAVDRAFIWQEPADADPVDELAHAPEQELSADLQEASARTSVDRIVELHEQAAAFYAGVYAGSSAADYIARRFGDDLSADDRVTIGYAPPGWTTLTDHLTAHGASVDELVDAGLAKHSRRGTPIDLFRDRVVVGLRDDQGRLVGFSGRRAPGADDPRTPKYLNTPNTSAFSKGAVLFGLAENADRLIRRDATPVRVEGVFDAIAVTRATDGRAVGLAPMGTALTEAQGDLLAAVANGRPILEATDTDRAGREAAAKDDAVLADRGADLRRLVLLDPSDPTAAIKDPAELIARDNGAEKLATLTDAVDLAPSVTAERIVDTIDAAGRDRLAENVGTRVQVARAVGRIIATAPAHTWDTARQTAAQTLADRCGDPDDTYARELIDTETERAAADLVPAGTADRGGLDALATAQFSRRADARLDRIRQRLASRRAQTPSARDDAAQRRTRPQVLQADNREASDRHRGRGLS